MCRGGLLRRASCPWKRRGHSPGGSLGILPEHASIRTTNPASIVLRCSRASACGFGAAADLRAPRRSGRPRLGTLRVGVTPKLGAGRRLRLVGRQNVARARFVSRTAISRVPGPLGALSAAPIVTRLRALSADSGTTFRATLPTAFLPLPGDLHRSASKRNVLELSGAERVSSKVSASGADLSMSRAQFPACFFRNARLLAGGAVNSGRWQGSVRGVLRWMAVTCYQA